MMEGRSGRERTRNGQTWKHHLLVLHSGSGREGCAVEDPRGFVADLLEDAAHHAFLFRNAFFAGRVRRLADAGHEGERAVERAHDFSDADLVRGSTELIAAVGALAALHEAPMLQREEDVLEKLLRDGFLLGEIADQDWAVALFFGEEDHGLE